jgi:LacI family transcriptional regulator
LATTIKDIAREVQTSAVTVSLALRGSDRISEATRKKVIASAKKLCYKPNRMAQGLVGASTSTAAFVIKGIDQDPMRQTIYISMFAALAAELGTEKYHIYLHTATENQKLADVLQDVSSLGADAVILVWDVKTIEDKKVLEQIVSPVILVNRHLEINGTNCVDFNEKTGISECVRYLTENGHNRIYFAGKNEKLSSIRRYGYFLEEMKKLNLDSFAGSFDCGYSIEAGKDIAGKISEMDKTSRPQAVLAATDTIAYGLLEDLPKYGINVPEDLSIIGIDDIAMSELVKPPLTSLHLDHKKLAASLKELIKNKGTESEKNQAVVPVELIKRKSVKEL